MDTFKVTIDRDTNTISVLNNGRGIPIEMHEKEGIYIPELIFGNLSVVNSSFFRKQQLIRFFVFHSQAHFLKLRRRREEADWRSKRFRSEAHQYLLARVQCVSFVLSSHSFFHLLEL
jgi:hypothetical protein